MRSIRFWIYINDAPVKLTLSKDNAPIHWGKSWPTDEGFSYEGGQVYLHKGVLYLERNSGGRDCDGPIDYFTDLTCSVDDIDAEGWPNWIRERDEVNDYFAQQAGY